MASVTTLPETFTYRIDRDDILVSVSDNWTGFAVENAGDASVSTTSVIGRALDDFMEDDETRSLYALVLGSVRNSTRPVAFRFRCDAPAERRFCELTIKPDTDGSVDFESRILRTESREPVALLRTDVQRETDEFLKACSVCKRIAVGDDEWIEIEPAMQRLKLDEREQAPRITHGLCTDCHARIIASL